MQMLAKLILILFLLFSMLSCWLIFSGWLLGFSLLVLMILAVLVWNYSDKAILYFLGAREVMSSDGPAFHKEAMQQAYKLAVPAPSLYFYNGSFERAFMLQSGKNISLVLSRSLLEGAQQDEFAAICFSLLIQAKKGLAPSRTKAMFILGGSAWFTHGLVNLVSKVLPSKQAKAVINLIANYFLHPWLKINFHLLIGNRYFKKVAGHLAQFPLESAQLNNLYLRLRHPDEIYSSLSRRLMELFPIQGSLHYQNILSLELLPHEWDYYQQYQEGLSDKEAARD